MTQELMQAFTTIQPLCDSLLLSDPLPDAVTALYKHLLQLTPALIQEMQYYILFPVFAHILKIKEVQLDSHQELKLQLLSVVKLVLEKSKVYSPGKHIQDHVACLLDLVYDVTKPDMIAKVHEELLLDVMLCLTRIMVKMERELRHRFFRTQVALVARVIFVAVHIAKLEKLRVLRLTSLECLTAYTAVHPAFTDARHRIADRDLEAAASNMNAGILPGVLAALQDVATNCDNPGHAVVVKAIRATHKIVCQVMKDTDVPTKDNVSIEDFTKILRDKLKLDVEVKAARKMKDITKKTPEWYHVAAEKLKIVTHRLTSLQTHEHYKVRRELAVYCSRLLLECSRTMQPSMTYVLDVLITLSNDDYAEVSKHCTDSLDYYFRNISEEAKSRTLDSLADNLMDVLQALPRILNNIDSSRKLAALNLLYGYLTILNGTNRPLPLVDLCRALIEAARHSTNISVLAQLATRDVTSPTPPNSPWCKLKHIDDSATEQRLQAICRLLGDGLTADLAVDELLETFDVFAEDRKEAVWLLNWIGSAPNNDLGVSQRILNKYIEQETWYLPLEVAADAPDPAVETLDLSVYDPLAWEKDSVPGLYEGAVETRYTDISYAAPRARRKRRDGYCATLAEAQSNMVLSCSLTEGLGMCAKRMGDDYQCYLLKTLCLVLERVGSKYELLHLAGLKAINDVTRACGHAHVAELIQTNADYFTYQVTTRLKKAWNSRSALEILTVVMEYSDSSILNSLYGIVSDVLVQSCDKYYKRDLSAYLQVFLTFVHCIHKWFPNEPPKPTEESTTQGESDILYQTLGYRDMMENPVDKWTEEDYERVKNMKEEDYFRPFENDEPEETVTEEKPPPPPHITLTVTILKRTLNFIPSKRREEKLLAMRVINEGLPILREYEDELLPLVHQVWAPLAARFGELDQPVVLRGAFQLLVTMAALSKDFIRHRTIKEVLPNLFKYLRKASLDSHLKDIGSAYRASQAFKVQVDTLTALPALAVDLCLDDQLHDAMESVQPYLSNRQPKPLQALAVRFFQTMLAYDHGAAWHHLRKMCGNESVLQPPDLNLPLIPVVGTFEPTDKCYTNNVKAIFENKR